MNFEIEPAVLGELAGDTVLDRSTDPPTVRNLLYAFDSYGGVDVVTSFPAHLVRERLRDALVDAGITGLRFTPARVSKGDPYDHFTPEVELPVDWFEMEIVGRAGVDDAWWGNQNLLTVTGRALEVFRRFDLTGADIHPAP